MNNKQYNVNFCTDNVVTNTGDVLSLITTTYMVCTVYLYTNYKCINMLIVDALSNTYCLVYGMINICVCNIILRNKNLI